MSSIDFFVFFFFNDTATTEIYTLSLHDALPISVAVASSMEQNKNTGRGRCQGFGAWDGPGAPSAKVASDHAASVIHRQRDRKSTRLNSSHANISYAVFCLKKKKKNKDRIILTTR